MTLRPGTMRRRTQRSEARVVSLPVVADENRRVAAPSIAVSAELSPILSLLATSRPRVNDRLALDVTRSVHVEPDRPLPTG